MPDSAHTLLRWTRFESDSYGTGPEKRSAQIRELCANAGFTIDDMRPPETGSRWQTWAAGLGARLRFGPYASVDRAGMGLLGFRTLFYREALARHRGTRVLLWETTYDTLLPAMARAAGYRVIALPHNLEALVSEAAFADSKYDPTPDLAGEVSRLAMADAVFAIAKEERWFLEARGLSPHYLPYFPDAALAGECARIREKRIARARPGGHVEGPLLMLGSAFNPATARGMALQLDWLAKNGVPQSGAVVAGPQTDTILARHLVPHMRLLGRVPRESLVELLETCSALLIHTFGGAGAVTRIPEALLAGVPVIANSNAARDQYGTPGVHIYDSHREFQTLVSAVLPLPPSPPPPVAETARFQEVVSHLTSPSHRSNA